MQQCISTPCTYVRHCRSDKAAAGNKAVSKKKINKKKKEQEKRAEERKQYFFVIRELTDREIRRKYARSYLGILWSVLSPLLNMVVMSLIFSTMFRRSIENFPIYYLTGNVFWSLFSTATNTSMTALVDNHNLLLKVKLPKQTFVLSRIYTALVNFLYTLIAYGLMLLVFRIRISATMLLLPVIIFFALLFSIGVGYILSILYVFFADIKHLYSIVLTLWMYLSAIFYPVSQLPEHMQRFIGWNPIYVQIAVARDCVMYGVVSAPALWMKLIGWGVGIFALGYLVFRKNQNKVMQKI